MAQETYYPPIDGTKISFLPPFEIRSLTLINECNAGNLIAESDRGEQYSAPPLTAPTFGTGSSIRITAFMDSPQLVGKATVVLSDKQDTIAVAQLAKLAGGSVVTGIDVNGALVGNEAILNLIQGKGITIAGVDNPGATRVDVTITGGIPTIALASFPPLAPADGDQYWLVIPGTFDAGGKVLRWLVEFDSANSCWHVAGGPMFALVTAGENRGNAAYGDLTTVGPQLTMPRPGDYLFRYGFRGQPTAAVATSGWASISIAGGTPADADGAVMSATSTGAAFNESAMQTRKKTIAAANDVAKVQYRTDAANSISFSNRYLEAQPIRIT